MENFFIDDKFFIDIGDLIDDYFDGDDQEVRLLPEDYKLKAQYTNLEKVFTVKKEQIIEAFIQTTDTWEDRFPEESDSVFKKIEAAVERGIDIFKINEAMPSLYYPNGKYFTITKQDLLDSL